MSGRLSKYIIITDLGSVLVCAASEAQAKSRAKWKAVHRRFNFRNRAEEMAAVRDCWIYRVKKIMED